MIKKICISNEDQDKIQGQTCTIDPAIKKMDFKGLVVNKPWGYEYLMFQTPEVAIWMLYIKKGYSTSVHCHPNKKTSLLVISGEAICSTLKDKFSVKEKEALIFDKGVFHTTEAVSKNGIFVMEIETPSDKTDLFRLTDKYSRVKKSYTDKKNITNKTYNYHYLYLNENNNNSTDLLGKYKFILRTYKDTKHFKADISRLKNDIGVVLSGKIYTKQKTIEIGEVFSHYDLDEIKIDAPVKLLFIHEKINQIRLSDYLISHLQEKGINDVFLISGGNLMYLLESIRIKNMNYICNHNEQASSMSADGYTRACNKPGFCMVTSGPGGTNAITGAVGAWIDSIPMLIISGQSYSTQTIGNSKLRQLGVQEINITDIVRPITKYSVMVKDPKKIKYHIDKALHIATTGRPGPVWLDIPVNIQLAKIQEEELESFIVPKVDDKKNEKIKEDVTKTISIIKEAKRPVILLGNGVRLAKAEEEFLKMADKLSIPILTARNANDLLWEDHPLFAGRPGSFGQRYANYTIQNSDLMLSIGSRIGLALTGWAYNDFARAAKKIIVDIDEAELKKPTIKPDLPIVSDAKEFILEMTKQLKDYKAKDYLEWKNKIKEWKAKYPICLKEYKEVKGSVNTYNFLDLLSEELNENDIIVTDMGMSFQCTMQGLKLKKGQKLLTESGLAAMGYGLPGAIGACIANNKKRVICISGDGGLQMNIQELQTVFHNKLPIKLFVFNNHGYSSQRETQRAYFEGYSASEPGSGVSTPDSSKVAAAYGIRSKKIEDQDNLRKDIKEALEYDGPYVCDLNVSEEQTVNPKQGAFNRPDGKTVPRPIEDMIPYVDREELEKDMIIDPVPFDPYIE